MQKNADFFDSLLRDIEENEKKFSNAYQIISLIGKGAFGSVLQCIDRLTNEPCAIKVRKHNYCKNNNFGGDSQK